MTAKHHTAFVSRWRDIDPAEWAELSQPASTYPFLRYEFLAALEESGSVGRETGWLPHHFTLRDAQTGRLLAAAPTYLKAHSYGEFVFDFAWAEAYQRYGVSYYPKLVTAVPFTPIVGPRLRVHPDLELPTAVGEWLTAVQTPRASSWHLFFADQTLHDQLTPYLAPKHGLLRRTDVNFLWHKRDYRTFDDFLATLKARKRNQIRKERAHVAAQGITFAHVSGTEISAQQQETFYLYYQATYWKYGQEGYLTDAFFEHLVRDMPESLLFVFAQHEGQDVAVALFLLGDDTLHGRYWGCLDEYNFLHFETTLYQGIDYCLAHNLAYFDAGAQGEHKLRRGFEPFFTHSYHWIAHPAFREAIANFLVAETPHVQAYHAAALKALPFKVG